MFQGVKSSALLSFRRPSRTIFATPCCSNRGNLRADECKTALYLWQVGIGFASPQLRPRFFMRTALVFLALLLGACAEGTYPSPTDGRLTTRIENRSRHVTPAWPGMPRPTTSATPIQPPLPVRLPWPALPKPRRWSQCPIATVIPGPPAPSARTPNSAPWAMCCGHAVRSSTSGAPSLKLTQEPKRKRRETEIPRRRDRLRMLQGGGAVEPGLEVPRVRLDCGLRALRRPYQWRQSSPQDRADQESRRISG